MSAFNIQTFRSHFPLLHSKVTSGDLIYLDNAATTQKPQCVIDKYKEYYEKYNANVHRASHQLSSISTSAFEQARLTVKNFINSKHVEEIIWTKGTTESMNLISSSLGELLINEGDELILSQSEHHANIVPWQLLAEKNKAIIKILPVKKNGVIDVDTLETLITKKTKIVSVAHISNVIGKTNPIKEIVETCKKHNVISIIDGAQAIAHQKIDVQAIDCDFYLFSAHKMYGPTGVGVLYGKRDWLNKMPPYHGGGEMIKKVSFSGTTYNTLPFKFEAGTPNIAGIIAFLQTLNFIEHVGLIELINYEEVLTQYCYQQLKKIKSINFIVEETPHIPVFSFTIKGQHNHDVATFLDANGIAVRSGHHCAMPLMEFLNLKGCIRVSLSAYNTIEEVDYLVNTIKKFTLNNEESSLTDLSIVPESKNEIIPTENNQSEFNKMPTSDEILNIFSQVKGWDGRHREIMLMGKRFPRLDKNLKIDGNLVDGCESSAWLTYKVVQHNYIFQADSDAKVIRGLLTIVLAAYNDKNKVEIQSFDINRYFSELGLEKHLSPSRANGLLAIVDKIKLIANV